MLKMTRALARYIPVRNARIGMSIAFAFGASALASAQTGGVTGVARGEESGAPIPFVLVRLLPTDSQSVGGRQEITNAEGRFRFTSVLAGSYRLQLLRIGYRPVLSPILEVRAGATTEQEVRASMTGLPLPPVVVYGEGTCLTGDRANGDPYLATLWEDIRKGVEIRRAFDQRYRYKRALVQTSEVAVPSRAITKQQRADTVVNEPDSALVREARVLAQRAAEGFGKGNNLILPNEKELVDDSFLRSHCLLPATLEADGATGIRFRQAAPRRDGFGLQGTIWVDAATRLMRRLELEYLNGDKPFSNVTVEYTNVAVAGTTLRLSTTGSFSLRPLQAPRGTTVTGTFSFTYWGFDDVRAK